MMMMVVMAMGRLDRQTDRQTDNRQTDRQTDKKIKGQTKEGANKHSRTDEPP